MRRSLPIVMVLIALLVADVIATPFLFVGGVFYSIAASDRDKRTNLPIRVVPIPFDASTWRADHSGFGEKRLAMLDDLLASRVWIGKSKDELSELLGGPGSKPDHAGIPSLRESLRQWDRVYIAGNRDLSPGWFDPHGLDYSYIVVRFGNDGRVVEAREVQG